MKKTLLITACLLSGTLLAQEPEGVTLTLEQVTSLALQNNIATRTAKQDLEAARQQRKEAFTNYFPTVSGTGAWFNANRGTAKMEINPSEVIPSTLVTSLAQSLPAEALAALASPISMSMMKNGTIAGVTALQPVFAGGQIVNGNKLAKVGEEVSRLKLHLSENEVELQAQQYFWQLASLLEKKKTVEAVEALLNDLHKDVDVAVTAGVALRNDLLQVQLRQNEVASQKLTLNNGIELVGMLLAQYCGLESTDFQLIYQEDTSFPLSLKQDHRQALQGTSEYQLLSKNVEATDLQRKMEVGKNLPTVAVGAGYNYHTLMDNDRTFGMVFATVSVPISDWWGGSHAIKRKKIAQRQAQEQLADNAELLQIRMQKAWNDVEESYQQLTIALRSIEQSAENLRIHQDYYRAGTTTMSDLLEAQLLYQQSCDSKTDAYATYQTKILEYRQAVGM